jgi:hypothetical protein
MAGSPKRQLSLDTNLPLDLAKALDFAHEFREEFQQRGYVLRLSPTVLAELEYLILSGSEKNRRLAEVAFGRLGSWRLTPFDLPEVHHVVAERFARRLQHQRLIPEDEFHDGLILAETALGGIPLLVTSDKHLLGIDEADLLLACNEADLPPVRPVHPKGLLRALR